MDASRPWTHVDFPDLSIGDFISIPEFGDDIMRVTGATVLSPLPVGPDVRLSDHVSKAVTHVHVVQTDAGKFAVDGDASCHLHPHPDVALVMDR